MDPRSVRAVFMRGGTSKALIFHAGDLPGDRSGWDSIFLSAMGTPDPFGRQLNGMGGGLSSLSKVAVIGPSTHPDADLDYTFAQVSIKEARVEYRGNCGNISSAVGPFAIDENLLSVPDGAATVRIHNTNTKRIIHATFAVENGRAAVAGNTSIPGVAGTGAPIRLDFLEPGGAMTGKLLPTGQVTDIFDIDGVGPVEISIVDAGNACVFISAASLGLNATESPDTLEGTPGLLKTLRRIGEHALVRLGFAENLEAASNQSVPLIGIVGPAADSVTLAGEAVPADAANLCLRMISSGQPHRASPLTGALCTAVAAAMSGTIPNRFASRSSDALRLATPSGVLEVSADVSRIDAGWNVSRASFFRTARRLFEGRVYI